MKVPWCSECTVHEDKGPSRELKQRNRVARALAGAAFLVLGWALLSIPLAYLAWPLAAVAAWFGFSHPVAACTA
jgi:hypothetical protein